MKPEILRQKFGIEILGKERPTAQINLLATIPTQTVDEKAEQLLQEASLYFWERNTANKNSVNVEGSETTIRPRKDQYVRAEFRAISQSLLQSRGLDFSVKGVLEEGVSLLEGRSVYPNHEFRDINNALGVVSRTWWDKAGEDSDGVPGINCEIKIDALMNLRIARGLLMDPPAINSMSLTIIFEFDYSHPDLVSEYKFWPMLGEEVDGEIVRLIVTRIVDIWEASLVSVGQDPKARKIGGESESDEPEGAADKSFSAELAGTGPASINNDKEKTMKLTKEQLEALGLDAAAEDVADKVVIEKAVEFAAAAKKFDGVDLDGLQAKAEISDKYVDSKRKEVRRLARLAELGAEEGDLDEIVEESIKEADFAKLEKLGAYYEKKAKEGLPPGGRSSEEGSLAVDAAGGAESKKPLTRVGLH